jgi:hypothetical protein
MVPAGGKLTLQPAITSDTGTVTLGAPTSDAGISVNVTQSSVRLREKERWM